jgi:hypothetical protein
VAAPLLTFSFKPKRYVGMSAPVSTIVLPARYALIVAGVSSVSEEEPLELDPPLPPSAVPLLVPEPVPELAPELDAPLELPVAEPDPPFADGEPEPAFPEPLLLAPDPDAPLDEGEPPPALPEPPLPEADPDATPDEEEPEPLLPELPLLDSPEFEPEQAARGPTDATKAQIASSLLSKIFTSSPPSFEHGHLRR